MRGGDDACAEGGGSGEEAAAVLLILLEGVLGGDVGGADGGVEAVGLAEEHGGGSLPFAIEAGGEDSAIELLDRLRRDLRIGWGGLLLGGEVETELGGLVQTVLHDKRGAGTTDAGGGG